MSMYIPEDLQFLRVYKCVNQVGRDLMLVVFKWGFTLSQDETLRTYLFTKNNFNNSQFKRRYDEDQKKKIDTYDSHNGLKFDVSVLFRLIQDTSNYVAPSTDPIWTTNNPTQLEYILHKIKKTRNDLTHTPLSLDDTSADQMIQEYKVLYFDFIEAVGIRYGRDVAKEKANLNKDIDELMNHCLSENEIQHLFTEQRHERSKEKMLAEGVPEMKMKYMKKADLNPLTLIDGSYFRLPVMRVYKELEIRACGRNSKDTIIDNNDILRLNHLWETVTDLKDAADLVILEGPTGSGKTTITKKVIAEWSTNQKNSSIKGLLDYSVLIYMECRNSTESLKNLLHSLMPKTFLNLKGEPEKALSDCPVLVVIDSLDELNENSETLFKELLELIKMENITGICTMRPTKTKEVFSLLPSELKRVHLKSRGIPDGQRGSFVEMYHAELRKQGMSQQSTEQLVQQINKSSSLLQEHLRYPINLVHIAYLWAIAPEKVRCVATATELYSNIHEVVQIKLFSERLISNSRTKGLTEEECRKKMNKFLGALHTEAMLNLTRQQFCVLPKDSETELKKVCKDNDLPQCEILSAFLVTRSLYTGITAETEYSISHTNMQEYLAACCIFNAVKNKCVQKLKTRITNVNQNCDNTVDKIKRSLSNVNINFFSNNPVSDVLEIFFPDKDIQYKDFQNVFKHLTGLFVLNDETMSTKVAKDLVELLKKSGMMPEDWLNIYAEAKSDKCIVKYLRRLCSDMLSGDIIIRDSHLAAYSILLDPKPSKACKDVVDSASAVKANSIDIKLENPPSEHPDLRNLMVHAINLPCSVELHIYSNWRNPKPGVTKDILNKDQERFNLKVMRGSPSSSELRAMAPKLERLYISLCDDEHAKDVLNIFKTEKFPKLGAIYFHLKCSDVSSEALQPFTSCRVPKIFLFLSDVDDSNVVWAAKVAKALQLPNGEYDCLYLPNNRLTSSGFVNIVNELHQNNVKILVRIGVTSDLVDEKEDEPLEPLKAAKVESLRKFRCDVLWYFNAERMEGW